MSYKVLLDSCGELTKEMKEDGHFQNIALSIMVDDYSIVDDETFNQKEFLEKVAASPNCPKSACPSPEVFMKAIDDTAQRVYIVTLSAKLSGSYNSAVLANNLFGEDRDDKMIYVFNSRSASVGETLIACKIQELEEKGMSFEEVIETTEKYIEEQHTYFVLETLEHLRKNGRISNLKALAAEVLNIKPIMGATPEGEILQLDQTRGMKKALAKMVECMLAEVQDVEEKTLAISHCNCREKAELVKSLVEKKMSDGKTAFREIFIVEMAGISSLYAADGGIIMVV